MQLRNLFADLPATLDEEYFETILQTGHFRLERIVSQMHATPAGQWYDQKEDEWVLLLSGGATLTVEGEEGPVTLKPGDSLLLPAHRKHRVEATAPGEKTVWLALHYTS